METQLWCHRHSSMANCNDLSPRRETLYATATFKESLLGRSAKFLSASLIRLFDVESTLICGSTKTSNKGTLRRRCAPMSHIIILADNNRDSPRSTSPVSPDSVKPEITLVEDRLKTPTDRSYLRRVPILYRHIPLIARRDAIGN